MGVILTFFTGGATAVVQATNAAEKGTAFLKIFAQEMVATATLGISAIMQLFRMLITKFIQACKNGWIGLKKFLDELLNGKVDYIARNEEVLNDEIDISKVRAAILAKWIDKFEIFYKHFDGEIIIRSKKSKESIEINGAHNYLQNGKKINITFVRKPPGVKLDDIPDDVPFIANVEFKYANRYVQKKNTSSFFPKNWDQIRVEEEIALVYDKMNKSGFELNFAHNKYRTLNSEGTFEILIEIKKNGQISSAYPYINL